MRARRQFRSCLVTTRMRRKMKEASSGQKKKKPLMNPIHQGGAAVNLESRDATRPRLNVSLQHRVKWRRRLLLPRRLQRVQEKWVKRVVLALRGGETLR